MNIDVIVKIRQCFSIWKDVSNAECPGQSSEYSTRSPLHAPRSSAAFTLIEVLVAMAVLSILIVMAANIFQSSSIAWNIGSQKANMNTAARAVMDFMARELESAVAGPIETAVSGANPASELYLADSNDIRFAALTGESDLGKRALRASLFRYYATDNELQYKRETDDFDPYTDTLPTWASFPNPLIGNVLGVSFYVYTNETDLLSGNYIDDFPRILNELPLCMDIALEILSDDDMEKYNQLSGAAQTAFRSSNAKLYTTRVYFPNRMGYR